MRPVWVRLLERRTVLALVAAAALAVAFVLALRWLPLAEWIRALTTSLLGLGWLGVALFAAGCVVAALLFVPGGLLKLTSGAVFGVPGGLAIMSLSTTAAAALAFVFARTLLRHRVEAFAARTPRFAAFDRAIGRGGWRVVALLRLSPAVPFSVSNYLYGLTRIRFVPYIVTSWLAMLPVTFALVYLGHVGSEAAMASAGVSVRDPLEWGLLGLGAFATVAVTVYVTRLARSELARETQIDI